VAKPDIYTVERVFRRPGLIDKRVNLLAVVDDPEALALVERASRDHGMDTVSRSGVAEALKDIRELRPDAVVVDLQAQGTNGIELLRAIREVYPSCAVILVTGQTSVDSTIEAVKLGVIDCLSRPPDLDRLRDALTTVVKAIERRETRLKQDAQAARQAEFHGLIGRSAPMQDLFDAIRRLAPHAWSLIVAGEPGTGKELVARALHQAGPRRDLRFVTLNCPTAGVTLFESALFGHVRGAFAGAIETRVGAFEEADGGTLFLDEIANVPPDIQPKLLRAVETGQAQPLGAVEARRFDVRVIAATARDLRAEVAAGRLQRDFIKRVSAVRLNVPALRERREDIPLLTAAFLHDYSLRTNRAISGLTTAAERVLQHARWDGNVRELKDVVERACSMSDSRLLGEREILASIAATSGETISRASAEANDNGADTDLLSSAQRRQIERVLTRVGGNKTEAARLLGISRRALYRWLERLGSTARR
jgi:DNA-binding NtrC family response regulator